MPPLLPLLLLTCIQSLRGRVAVNSDSVDSEDYYYFPEVEDYEFYRPYYGPVGPRPSIGPIGIGYDSSRDYEKQVRQAERRFRNKERKAFARAYGVSSYGGPVVGPVPVYPYPYSGQGARIARQARRQARAARNYGGYIPYPY